MQDIVNEEESLILGLHGCQDIVDLVDDITLTNLKVSIVNRGKYKSWP